MLNKYGNLDVPDRPIDPPEETGVCMECDEFGAEEGSDYCSYCLVDMKMDDDYARTFK